MQCKLCLEDHELCNSHIIPEFLYTELYNDKNQLLGINGLGKRGCRPLQKGIREYLFCKSCEQHFNELFEKPFLSEWVRNPVLPPVLNVDETYTVKVNYEKFKLFHLSVLFRAGVSSLPTFEEVQLGSHREKLRKMILHNKPGEVWEYPIFGLLIVNPEEKAVFQMVSKFVANPVWGHKAYFAIYGGVQWWFVVSSHKCRESESISLKENGTLPLHAVNWNEIGLIRHASELLRQKSP